MLNQMDRLLIILADGAPVTGYARVRLLGAERLAVPSWAKKEAPEPYF